MMRISEIYRSIQGESTYAGQPCVFVRTAGCNLRCSWCDSSFTFHGGQETSLEDVLNQVRAYCCRLVELTGGEPLLQQDSFTLTRTLLDEGYQVLVETGGSLDIRDIDRRANVILDIKCPASGMSDSVRWSNLEAIKKSDQVKFVINDRLDYLWATERLDQLNLCQKTTVLFSPVFGVMDPRRLAEWILQDNLEVCLQLQLHKYIWHPEARGV